MKILVISDIHDHIENLEKVLAEAKGKVETIICCGDFCAPFISKILGAAGLPIYACLGNNDQDQVGIIRQGGAQFTLTALYEEYGQVTLDGKRIAYCHYPKFGELLAKSGEYDAVFYGHNHTARNEVIGKTLLVNPGSVSGISKGRPGPASYAIYDTELNSAENLVVA